MDPDACLDRVVAALHDRDIEEAANAAEDLMTWLDGGGFPPQRYTPEDGLRIILDALTVAGEEGSV